MITIFLSFMIVAGIFYLFSLFNILSWFYYVPSALVFSQLWLRVYNFRFKSLAFHILKENPELFEDEVEKDIFLASPSVFLAPYKYITTFVRFDFTSAIGYSMFIAIFYGIYSIFKSEWIVMIVCIWMVYDTTLGKIAVAFEAYDDEQNILRVGARYLKSKKVKIIKLSKYEVLDDFTDYYYNIVHRLRELNQGN